MATVELGVNHKFPAGTEVGVYPDTSIPPGHTGSPQAAQLASGTVASDGDLALSDDDLLAGGRYVAAAEVGGTWTYLFFNVDPLTDDPITQAELDAALADLESVALGDVQELIDQSIESSEATLIAYVDEFPTTNVQTGTLYTPQSSDAGNVIVELTNNSEVSVTLPDEPAFVENAQIEFCALGTAGATFVAGSGASLDSPGGLVDLPQNCTAVARHRGGGTWLLSGALA